MKVGELVVVVADWSSFKGQRGRVVDARPLMVLLDGERLPMRFGDREVVPASAPSHHAGAE